MTAYVTVFCDKHVVTVYSLLQTTDTEFFVPAFIIKNCYFEATVN